MVRDNRIQVRGGTHAISSITYQTLFKYYPNLSGMTVSLLHR
jgi:preprotein translocase subunit SecA